MKNLDKLISSLPEVSKKKVNMSFFEVGRITKNENIISNYLLFFFNQEAHHGLDTLFLSSLLEIVTEKDIKTRSELVEIKREVRTKDNKRIDLLIVMDDKVVVIENKIFHQLVNPLKSYIDYAEDKFKEQQKFYVVLSVFSEKNKHGFVNVTFEELSKVIKRNLPIYLNSESLFYSNLAIELLDSLKRLKYGSMDQKEINYIKDNFDDFIHLKRLFESYFGVIEQKLNDLEKVLTIKKYTVNTKRWKGKSFQKRLLNVLFYSLIPVKDCDNLQLKIRLSAKGWNIEIWNTNNLTIEIKDKLNKGISGFQKSEKGEEYYIFYKTDFDTSFETVKKEVDRMMTLIYES